MGEDVSSAAGMYTDNNIVFEADNNVDTKIIIAGIVVTAVFAAIVARRKLRQK